MNNNDLELMVINYLRENNLSYELKNHMLVFAKKVIQNYDKYSKCSEEDGVFFYDETLGLFLCE